MHWIWLVAAGVALSVIGQYSLKRYWLNKGVYFGEMEIIEGEDGKILRFSFDEDPDKLDSEDVAVFKIKKIRAQDSHTL